MKKLYPRYKRLLLHRARTANKKIHRIKLVTKPLQQVKPTSYTRVPPYEVTVWDGDVVYKARCYNAPYYAPSNLCLTENSFCTFKFLEDVRNRTSNYRPDRNNSNLAWVKIAKRGLPKIQAYLDFSRIEKLSTAAALVITSYYDSAKRMKGSVPPAINLNEWSDNAFIGLYEIGFFELIGDVTDKEPSLRYHQIDGGKCRIMQVISGKNGNALEKVGEGISELLATLRTEGAPPNLSPEINTAVGEAMINVARHAYPQSHRGRQHYQSVNRWWVTAKADIESNTLTIVIYDHGATIPGTLPNRKWYNELVEEIREGLSNALNIPNSPRPNIDHEFIAHSMKIGKTQTNEPGRGLGLPQMQDLIDFCGVGCLRIYSRAGSYIYEKGNGVLKSKLPTPIVGTLVEWELQLPIGRSGI